MTQARIPAAVFAALLSGALIAVGCGSTDKGETTTKTVAAPQSSAQRSDQNAGAQTTTTNRGSAVDQQGANGASTSTAARPSQNPDAASGANVQGQGTALPDSSVVAPPEDQSKNTSTGSGAAPSGNQAAGPAGANSGALDIPSQPANEDLSDIKVRACIQGQAATVAGAANVNNATGGGATTTTSTSAGSAVDQGGNPFGTFSFFSDVSPWNVRVDALPSAPNSDSLLRFADERQTVLETPTGVVVERRRLGQGVFINTCRWTDPVVSTDRGVPTPVSCRQILCGSDAGVTSLDIPRDESPDPSYDGWFTVLDRSANVAWDLWRARRERNGSISFQFIRKWQLNGPGFLKPGNPSARGSGLPLFAGLITPQELRDGRINHALAMSVPGPAQRLYVQPASRSDGAGRTASLPEGARIRLRSGAHVRAARGTNPRAFTAIINALKTYGAIIVDRAAVPTLYAQKNASYRNLLPGNALQGIKLADFDVIQLGTRFADPPVQAGNVLVSPVALQPAGATAGGG